MKKWEYQTLQIEFDGVVFRATLGKEPVEALSMDIIANLLGEEGWELVDSEQARSLKVVEVEAVTQYFLWFKKEKLAN